MIPGDDFAVGPAPPTAQIPVYLFPTTIALSYREGEEEFTPEEPPSPISIVAVSMGPFEAEPLIGPGLAGYGFRIELRRNGVYGTLLLDTLIADIFVQSIEAEGCPDITVAADEDPVDVILSSIESCPPPGVITEEAGVTVIATDDF